MLLRALARSPARACGSSRGQADARGVYSGALGFLSVDGAADLSVAIRVAVLSPDGARVGAGGAIIALSDPREEWAELCTKARAVTQAA